MNNATTMSSKTKQLQAIERLLHIMDELRGKCPWDKKQTIESLRHLTIEEVYELSESIIKNDLEEIKGELGDLFLHIVFYCKIMNEQNIFDIADVANHICEKLIFRHPHIYGDLKVSDENDVKKNWEQLKLKEGKKSVLEGVPKSLPSLVKAYRIQQKVASVGFDWQDIQPVLDKVKEEINELQKEIEQNDQNKIEEEFGDVLFSLVNYARHLKIDPEAALEKTNNKFRQRFEFIENNAKKPLTEMNLQEMDILWEQAKKQLKPS